MLSTINHQITLHIVAIFEMCMVHVYFSPADVGCFLVHNLQFDQVMLSQSIAKITNPELHRSPSVVSHHQ